MTAKNEIDICENVEQAFAFALLLQLTVACPEAVKSPLFDIALMLLAIRECPSILTKKAHPNMAAVCTSPQTFK